jgi:hypothetical protein
MTVTAMSRQSPRNELVADEKQDLVAFLRGL